MLKSIHVENVALIDEADVSFEKGLNILTGETGAGKSIIIGSVNMALGGRSSRDMIRTGADFALSELDFEVEDERILEAIAAMGLPTPDDHVVISRRQNQGRSVARINGEMVSLSVLKQAASLLIDIHGQHEHQSLLQRQNHIGIVDRYAREELKGPLGELGEAYAGYRELKKALSEAISDESERKREISFLEYQISEIDAAALKPGEEEELDALFRKMSNSRKLLESAARTHSMTGYDSSGSAGDTIGRAIKELGRIEELDDELSGLSSMLMDIDALLADFNRELAAYEDSLVFDEGYYSEVEKRLGLISDLKNKYGGDVEGILLRRDEFSRELEKLENYEEYLEGLRADYESREREVSELCDSISDIRSRYSLKLREAISEAMRELNFPDVRFDIICEKTGEYSSTGQDSVEFMISTNAGEELRPLANVASGGELSRIMLAIKSVFAGVDEIPTLIFDEIDSGISGRTAQMVSEKMALIASSHQVICITHLPQIASMADAHFMIEKRFDGERTKTEVKKLEEEQSVEEIARLLGGAQITEAVMENAREMRSLAKDLAGKGKNI